MNFFKAIGWFLVVWAAVSLSALVLADVVLYAARIIR